MHVIYSTLGVVTMHRFPLASLLVLALTVPCLAQSSSSSPANAGSGTPSAGQQDSSSPPPVKSTAKPADDSAKKKGKKVWTNDELGTPHSGNARTVAEHESNPAGEQNSSHTDAYNYLVE